MLHFHTDLYCPQSRRFPGVSPMGREHGSLGQRGCLGLRGCTKYTGLVALLSWPGDSRAAPLFQLVQWVAAGEITQILVLFQQAIGTLGRESNIQLKKKKGSEAGSQVIRLGGSHPHKNKNKKTAI